MSDEEARLRAVDPAHHVVLEASAGTGKTHVLVDRYLNLLARGVDPVNILAITFTRKAAAEMRARILTALRERAARSPEEQALWAAMRDRSADISISTIDAFCLSLLHEFPLEADLDPGFAMADDTEAPRLMEEALDRALDICRNLARTDEYVKLLFAELKEPRIRDGLAGLIERRLVVEGALARALHTGPRDLTADAACAQAFERLSAVFAGLAGGLDQFLDAGPVRQPRYQLFAADMRMLSRGVVPEAGLARSLLDRIGSHFLTEKREPRQRFSNIYKIDQAKTPQAWRRHLDDIRKVGPGVAAELQRFRRDLNAVLARGVRRMYHVALAEYRRALESHGVLDFTEVLVRAVALLSQMEEFARSRYRLEARYHHVLVDEFQDTSRAQWELVSLLIRSWGEGMGLSEAAAIEPTIFLVGDRKQSIYGFRDADVAVMKEAAAFVDELRPAGDSRRAISRSFRAVPQLLGFINDLFSAIDCNPARADAFEFSEHDRFPVPEAAVPVSPLLGIVGAPTVAECAERVAGEIQRLIDEREIIRDPQTRGLRPVSPRDIGILFRTKDSHQTFEKALDERRIPAYVYKGLGFFEADEIKDCIALLRYLAAPESHLRAAALMRSRFIRLSDPALQTLAPDLAGSLSGAAPSSDAVLASLADEDRGVLLRARAGMSRWLSLVDRLPPADLLELVLDDTAYLFETRGPRARQARENLKKMRSMVRRAENRGYATMSRIAEHLERLTTGDESNATLDAGDAVSLMTVHAAKGLEFPVVFVVNLSKGTGGRKPAIRVASHGSDEAWISVGEFQSEADEDAKDREREETKRLLYVALTRARDRLYLASEVKEGKWRPAPGSLGEVLPDTLRVQLEAASAAPASSTVEWTAASGVAHTFRVCGAVVAKVAVNEDVRAERPMTPPDDFAPMDDPHALPRAAVTKTAMTAGASRPAAFTDSSSHSLSGTLVHRMFERAGTSRAADEDGQLAGEMARLLRDEEVAEAEKLDDILARAVRAYRLLAAQPSLQAALESGRALFEVPFSIRPAAGTSILRGTFDCLVQRPDGGVMILELKTGRPMPEHAEQLATYVAAARALFPDAAVDGQLVYSESRERRAES